MRLELPFDKVGPPFNVLVALPDPLIRLDRVQPGVELQVGGADGAAIVVANRLDTWRVGKA